MERYRRGRRRTGNDVGRQGMTERHIGKTGYREDRIQRERGGYS